MLKRTISIIIALMFLLSSIKTVQAQGEGPYPVYIVQPGETLTVIAEKFSVPLQDLININKIVDSNFISEGTELIIPGFKGISGVLTTTPVEFGDNLPVLLRKYEIGLGNFQLLNSITSPAELYVGSNLILPEQTDENAFNGSVVVGDNDSILEAALRRNLNPWYLSKSNQLTGMQALSKDVLYFYSSESDGFQSTISDKISKIDLLPLPAVQGHTSEIRIFTDQGLSLEGSLGGNQLHFFKDDVDGFYYALQGIHALAQPGLMDLTINGQFDGGGTFSVSQMVLMKSGGYPNEELTVEDTKIDPETNEAESQQVAQIIGPATDEKFWDGAFNFPVPGSINDNTMGFSSYFGSRRSYNDGQYFGFHGGLDFLVVIVDLNIYAPAPGRVAYTGEMVVRGNTVFIDHGQGVYSGYAHMKEIYVNAGDVVQTGQVIGMIGQTGRVTGPHLHWDIFVNGNAVDPFDWIDNIYP